jgi:mono/diheme cytochrome c family protein
MVPKAILTTLAKATELETRPMKRSVAMLLLPYAAWFLGVSVHPAAAQPALNDKQLLGMRLFNQSCRVCHAKPQLTSAVYGPVLSTNTLGGQEDVMREFIMSGTPRMPGFKYHFEPAQIDAIVAYIKTVPAP